jgi:hypothetical protein
MGMNRGGRQDFDVGTVRQVQPFDDVEAVQLGGRSRDRRQIPAGGWGRAPHAATSIEHAMPFKNSTERADRGHRPRGFRHQRAMNGRGAKLPQVTVSPQDLSQGQHPGFHGWPGARAVMRERRTIAPVDAIQSRLGRAADPSLHRVQTDTRAAGRRPHRHPTANPSDQLSPPQCRGFFWSCEISRAAGGAGVLGANAAANAPPLVPTRHDLVTVVLSSDPEAVAL